MEPQPQIPGHFGPFQRDDYRLKAVRSHHQALKEIARAQARARLAEVALVTFAVAFVVVVVVLFAIANGVELPWRDLLGVALDRLRIRR